MLNTFLKFFYLELENAFENNVNFYIGFIHFNVAGSRNNTGGRR